MSVNSRRTQPLVADKAAPLAHVNPMGGVSYDISNPLTRLRVAASSCFFGEPQYYGVADAPVMESLLERDTYSKLSQVLGSLLPESWYVQSPAELISQAIDASLDFDPEATLMFAAELRQDLHMRVTPQVIMVRAANHPKVRGSALIRTYAPLVIGRIDEVATQMAYQLATYGKPIPNALKKAWRVALEGASEYHLAKYRLDSRQVKLVDVVNTVHANSPAIHQLMKGELKTTDLTWEAIVSAGGGSKAAWEQALPLLLNPKGHMALLRNLRNLSSHGLLTREVAQALEAGAETGKQLPFRYYSAYTMLRENGVPGYALDSVEASMMRSIANLPRFKGRVASLCDNSGSAQGACTSSMGKMRVSTIANLTGVLTGMAADEGYVGVFGDRLRMEPIRARSSVFDQLNVLEKHASGIGGGTENGIWLFFDQAIKNREHWDHIFVYSDMQAGHGGLYGENPSAYQRYRWNNTRYIDVAALVADYRKRVNPNVMVYLVQVAGYQDTLVPEFYDRTFILGGWSDAVLRFAHEMGKLAAGQ